MAQKGNFETDLHYVLRVLVHTQTIEVDWYGVAGVKKGPDQDRGPANRSRNILPVFDIEPAINSITMAPPPTPEQNLAFLYMVFKHSEFTPDWWAIGAEYSKTKEPKKSQKDQVQQKFKKLIESTGKYALVNGKVVDLEEDPDAPPPTTPAKRGRGGKLASGTPRSSAGRKRKAAAPKDDTDENESDGESTPVKKRAAPKRSAAKAAAEKVKEEASDDGGETNDNGETAEKSGDGDAEGDEKGSDDDDLGDYRDPKLGGTGRVLNPDDI